MSSALYASRGDYFSFDILCCVLSTNDSSSYVFCDRLCTVSSSFWKVFLAYSRCYSLLMRYATCSFALVASRTLCCVWCKQRKINRDTAHALMMREGSALCQGSCSVSENLRTSCRCRRMKSFWSLNSASADRSILLFCSHSWSPRWSFIVLCDFLVDKLA